MTRQSTNTYSLPPPGWLACSTVNRDRRDCFYTTCRGFTLYDMRQVENMERAFRYIDYFILCCWLVEESGQKHGIAQRVLPLPLTHKPGNVAKNDVSCAPSA